MAKYKYFKANAFTSGESKGNPAACIITGNTSLSKEEMLKIGKEHKDFVSEVVFIQNSNDADCMLTYYSSECEVDFCGHGTIAGMYTYIKENPEFYNKKTLLAKTHKKGIIKIYNHIKEEDAIYISAPEPIHHELPGTLQEIAKALSISADMISNKYPICLIDAGLRTLIVPIIGLKETISFYPIETRLKEFCLSKDFDITLVFSLETKDCRKTAHTRVFSPKFGYLEDPATGSGNSAFGEYLLKQNLWNGEPISIEQGGDDRIFNEVKLSTFENKILFGGSSTLKIEGNYFI
jgi:PhzF family phenazine biosynthesis protein